MASCLRKRVYWGKHKGLYTGAQPFALLADKKDNDDIVIKLNDRMYRMFWTPIGVGNNRDNSKVLVFLYFQDITEEAQMKTKYHDERLVAILVQVDNYDEVMNNTDEAKRPVVQAQVKPCLMNGQFL